MSEEPTQPDAPVPRLEISIQPEPEEREATPASSSSGHRRRRHHHHHHAKQLKDIARLVGGGLMVGCVILLGLAAWTEDAVVFQLGVRGTMVLASVLIILDGVRVVTDSLRRGKRGAACLRGAGYLAALIVAIAVLRHLLLS